MADDADVLVEVDGVQLGELAGAGDGLENGHGHGHLDVALHGAGHALFDEHGEGGDEHGVQHTGLALGEAVVVGGDEAQLLLFHPGLKGHQVAGHVPDLLHGAAALDVEGVQNVLGLLADGGLVGDIVGDGPHFLPIELLGVQPHAVVQVGLVDVQVHHAGIGAANLGQVQVPEAAAHLGGFAPVLYLGLHNGVTALHHTGDDGMALSGALQVGHHLPHGAAGVQLAQPLGGVGVLVVRGAELLDVHQHHGHVQIPDGGEHIVGGGVGEQLEDDQIHVGGAELVPGLLGQLLGGDDAAVDELHGIGNHGLKGLVLGLELRHQRGELGQIGPQGNGEHAHAGFCFN